MSRKTNSLSDGLKRMMMPAGLTAAVLLGTLGVVHAAGHAAVPAGAVSPIDDQSVSALESLDHAVETLASRVTPAVVNVSVVSRAENNDAEDQGGNGPQGAMPPGFQFFFGPQGRGQAPQQPQLERGIGSGVLISPDGYIVTNNHVVENATQIRVRLNDRREFTGKLIGTDKLTDLAVIKINATSLPYVSWGDSTRLHPGQTVLAFGSPFGYFQFSVTRGIISALNRPNPYSDDPRKPGSFIQTDAAINPGNSGGPLVDARGELIGINTFIITNSGSFAGAGFAIPSQIAHSIADQLIKSGSIHHGYLGISMNDVTPENANFFSLPDPRGAIVSQVTPDSPAATAGIKSGDVIRQLNGSSIDNSSALQVAVSTMAPGTQIELGVLRNGKPETLHLQVGELHGNTTVADNTTGDSHRGRLGLAIENLTPQMRDQLGLPSSVSGVAVDTVRPGSPADDAGIGQGDVILEVNRQPITSADKFASAVSGLPVDKDLLLLVWSHGGATYRVLHPVASDSSNGM